MALSSGFAAAAITFASFGFTPLWVASIPTLTTLAITFAGRYIGIRVFFNRLSVLLNADARLQKSFADMIEHIDKEHIARIEALLADIMREALPEKNMQEPLTDDEFQRVLLAFSVRLEQYLVENRDVINDKTTAENIGNIAAALADLSLGLLFFSSAFMTFTQKGFDGVNTIYKMATKESLSNMFAVFKTLIGVVPGLASAIFYGVAAFDFRKKLVNTCKFMYNNPSPRNLLIGTGLFVTNGLAAGSMTSIAKGIVDNPDNIFQLSENEYGKIFIADQTAGGLSVNIVSCWNKWMTPAPLPSAQDTTLIPFKEVLANAEDHPISHATAEGIRRNLRFFAPAPQVRENTSVQGEYIRQDLAPGPA
jgi:hypothetical protein